MPKYITIAPQFDPYSVKDLIEVPDYIVSEYDKSEAAYQEAADKYAALKAMIGNDESMKNYFNDYDDLMSNITNKFSQDFFDTSVRQDIKNLRKIWRDKGMPATAGVDVYNKLMLERARHPDIIGSAPTMLEVVNNPQGDYFNFLTGDRIYQSIFASAQQDSKDRIIEGTFEKDSNNPGLLKRARGFGYYPTEQQEILQGSIKPQYTNIQKAINELKGQIGYENRSEEDQLQIDYYINKAIIDGTAIQVQDEYMRDPAYIKPTPKGAGDDDKPILGTVYTPTIFTKHRSKEDDALNTSYTTFKSDYENALKENPYLSKKEYFNNTWKKTNTIYKDWDFDKFVGKARLASGNFTAFPLGTGGADLGGDGGKEVQKSLIEGLATNIKQKGVNNTTMYTVVDGEVKKFKDSWSDPNIEDIFDELEGEEPERFNEEVKNNNVNIYIIPEAIEEGMAEIGEPLLSVQIGKQAAWIPVSYFGNDIARSIINDINIIREGLQINGKEDAYKYLADDSFLSEINVNLVNALNNLKRHSNTNAETAGAIIVSDPEYYISAME